MEFKDYNFVLLRLTKPLCWVGFNRSTLQSSMDLKLTNCYIPDRHFFRRRAFVCKIEERNSQIGKYYLNEV